MLRIILYLGRIFLYFYNTADSRLYFVLLVHHLVHLVHGVDLVILHWNSFTGQQEDNIIVHIDSLNNGHVDPDLLLVFVLDDDILL